MTIPTNYDDVLEQLHSIGLVVDAIETGRLRRCFVEGEGRKKKGWYYIHEWATSNGDILLVGSYGIWHGNENNAQKISLKKRKLTPQEKAAIRERIASDKKRAAAARRKENERAQRRAEAAWRKCIADGESEYLKRKGVGAHGVRFSPQGNLVIPIHDANSVIRGLQVIYSDPAVKKKKGRDKDYWPTGLAKQGNFFLIGSPTWVVVVVEGYATGASIHEATGLPVAVAFDAPNLLPVCQALRKRYRQVKILIGADDDWLGKCANCQKMTTKVDEHCQHCGEPHKKINSGIECARAAAFAVDGAWVAPRFTDRGTYKWTDFNDLHVQEGLHLVRDQIESKLLELGWDGGKSGRTQQQGELGSEYDFEFNIEILLSRFALIYGTETVFDERLRRIISLSSLRAAGGKAQVRIWLEHPDRRIVLPEQVIFDPTAPLDDQEMCNLWGGWPTKPENGSCEKLLELLEFLCSNEENSQVVYEWILSWLAYPIQYPGAKMQTAILMHGPEGTGKNTFFGVIRKIYDRYGGIFDQTQLESQFNGFASGKLFMIGNEVVTRVELYHQQGRLKNMITEPEWQINEKNLPTRLEQNHCNFTFFSNRIDIAKLDPRDRRYCVVWTPEAASDKFYVEVADEIDNGGVGALHDFLLNWNLEGFHAHSKPPMTRAKRELQELSMDSVDRFWRDWQLSTPNPSTTDDEEQYRGPNGPIPVPCIPCLSEDLYELYRYWALKEGVPRAAPRYVLLGNINKKKDATIKPAHFLMGTKKKQQRFVFPPGEGSVIPPGESQQSFLTEKVIEFRDAMKDWKNDSD